MYKQFRIKKVRTHKNSKSITQEEINTAVEKYLASGRKITKIEMLPEDPVWINSYEDTDDFLKGDSV